jgi:hypothetical protein
MIELMLAADAGGRLTLLSGHRVTVLDSAGGAVSGAVAVNEVDGCDFGINFIPHTQAVTTWGEVAVGDAVNLEVDTMARYVARLREWG